MNPPFLPQQHTGLFTLGVDACGQPKVQPRDPATMSEREKRWRDIALVTGLVAAGATAGRVQFFGRSRLGVGDLLIECHAEG